MVAMASSRSGYLLAVARENGVVEVSVLTENCAIQNIHFPRVVKVF